MATEALLKAQARYGYRADFYKPALFGGLHSASIFRIDEIIAHLVEVEGCNINQNTVCSTSRVWVSKNVHEGVVKILLEKDDNNPSEPHDGSQRLPDTTRVGCSLRA